MSRPLRSRGRGAGGGTGGPQGCFALAVASRSVNAVYRPLLAPLVKRLEADGLLTRSRDPHDERTLVVALTPAGTALRRRAEKASPGA